MQKSLTIAAFLLTGYVSAASAADFTKPVADTTFNWTGPYVGGHVGYGWGKSEQFAPGTAFSTGDYGIDGWIGGAGLGYDFQFGQIVLGGIADISWSGLEGGAASSDEWGCNIDDGCVTEVKWFGTGRVRAGYAFGATLPYLTGGVAFGEVEAYIRDDPARGSDTLVGWTVGGGVEHAFNERISAKLEYLYTDLGDFFFYDFGGIPGHAKAEFSTVKLGVNFRF